MTRYQTVEIDGVNIFYREAGNPAHPTILLLHGFPASSFMFRELMARLADRFHLVAPDYPGFGHSDAPPRARFRYSFDRLAKLMGRFTEALGLDRYALYMQDFGGPVGFRMASQSPEKVAFLIIQNANAYEDGLPDSFWAPAKALWSDPSPENFARIRDLAMSDDALAWNYTHGVANPAAISPDSWTLQRTLLDRPENREVMLDLLYDYRTNPDLYPAWHDYFRTHRPPALIVWGRNDVIFPAAGAHAFLADLPDAELNLLDTGHFALEERSEEIARHIERFAEGLAVAA